MSMLKHAFVFFVFIMVLLAPVYADEGYIPYFPDFLEPDGIGFRGPSEIIYRSCMTGADIKDGDCSDDTPIGVPYSQGRSSVLASPITIEYSYSRSVGPYNSRVWHIEVKNGSRQLMAGVGEPINQAVIENAGVVAEAWQVHADVGEALL